MKTFCTYFNEKKCNSCSLLTMDYSAQLQSKEKVLAEALSDLGPIEFETSVGSPERQFRNKAKFTVTGTLEAPIIGLTGQEILDEGRELLSCPLHLPAINEMLPVIKDFIELAKLSPYNISEKKGELKGIIIFHSSESKESYLRFVTRSKEAFDRIKKHNKFIKEKIPHLKTISMNVQPVPHAILEGDEELFVTEDQFITNVSGKVEYFLDPRAFVQTNQLVAKKLYQTAADWIHDLRVKKFMELFCGQGAFSFYCAHSVEEGLGIEINQDAVKMASSSARKAGLSKISFKASDATSIGVDLKNFSPDVVLVNPPRRGIGEATRLLKESSAKYVVYSSCNYQTLALDLKNLAESFTIKRAKLFDMFPHTHHFETLVLLERTTSCGKTPSSF